MNEQKEKGWWKGEFHREYLLILDNSEDHEAFISKVELDARKDEREKVLGEVIEVVKELDAKIQDVFLSEEIIKALKSLSGNNE